MNTQTYHTKYMFMIHKTLKFFRICVRECKCNVDASNLQQFRLYNVKFPNNSEHETDENSSNNNNNNW